MSNLSLRAKDIILTLLEEGYDLHQIKLAMEDGAYLSDAKISQELVGFFHILPM